MTRTIDWCMPSWAWSSNNHNTDGRVNGEAMWNSPTHYDIRDALNDISSQIYEVDSDTLGAYLNNHFGGNNGGRKYAVMTIILQTCNS